MRRFSLHILAATVIVVGCARPATIHAPDGIVPPACRTAIDVNADQAPAVGWVAAPDRDDHIGLQAWCRAVGPALVAALPGAAVDSAAPDLPLAIVSWNTHVGGGDVSGLLRFVLGEADEAK